MRKHNRRQESGDGSFDEREVVSSATECTGLMPAVDADDIDAAENEARLYAVHAPKERTEGKDEPECGGKGDGKHNGKYDGKHDGKCEAKAKERKGDAD